MRRASIAIVAFLALGLDCEETGLHEELAEARKRWREHGYTDYALTLERDCYCLREARGPVIVQKRFGEIVARSYVESGEPVTPELERFFPDIEGLFDMIEEAIDRDAASIRAQFDPDFGHPTEIFVDYEENVADEEQGYRVIALQPLRTGG